MMAMCLNRMRECVDDLRCAMNPAGGRAKNKIIVIPTMEKMKSFCLLPVNATKRYTAIIPSVVVVKKMANVVYVFSIDTCCYCMTIFRDLMLAVSTVRRELNTVIHRDQLAGSRDESSLCVYGCEQSLPGKKRRLIK